MNDYQKAIKRGIENALDKYDKKCQAIAKNEPKVWLTVEEASRIDTLLQDVVALHDQGHVKLTSTGFETIRIFKERFEQAEAQK